MVFPAGRREWQRAVSHLVASYLLWRRIRGQHENWDSAVASDLSDRLLELAQLGEVILHIALYMGVGEN